MQGEPVGDVVGFAVRLNAMATRLDAAFLLKSHGEQSGVTSRIWREPILPVFSYSYTQAAKQRWLVVGVEMSWVTAECD